MIFSMWLAKAALHYLSSLGLVQGWIISSSKLSSNSIYRWHLAGNGEANLRPVTLILATSFTLEEPDTSSKYGEIDPSMASLAATTVALLTGNEAKAQEIMSSEKVGVHSSTTSSKQTLIREIFNKYDVCGSGRLSPQEAKDFFRDLALGMVTELSQGSEGVSRSHAQRVLNAQEAGDTIERVATKLQLLADLDKDGRITLSECAELLDLIYKAGTGVRENDEHQPKNSDIEAIDGITQMEMFPQPLLALAGSLQLLPPTEKMDGAAAASKTDQWNVGVPGDDHSLRRVILEQNSKGDPLLSVVGLGRSADASAYFLPEWGICLDAGIHVKSLNPKLVLLTHGHRDHISALPVHASHKAHIFAPSPIAPMVTKFLIAEAQLNFGDASQTDEETMEYLPENFQVRPVQDKQDILLTKDKQYTGSPTPLGVEIWEAPHKTGVPAVSYGIYRLKRRLKAEYKSLSKQELGLLAREQNVTVTEEYQEGVLFYTGDTKIDLLRNRWKEILPKYKYMIHEVTFLGQPSPELDQSTAEKGHTHYAQLHPWICAFPETTFICVHWSLRYSRQDVLDFFEEQYGGVPKNVVLWI